MVLLYGRVLLKVLIFGIILIKYIEMKTRQIFRKFKLAEPKKVGNTTITHEVIRVKINNSIPPSHKDFQSI